MANAAVFYDSVDPQEVTLGDLLLILGPVFAAITLPGILSLLILVRTWRARRQGHTARLRTRLAIIAGFWVSIAASLFMLGLR